MLFTLLKMISYDVEIYLSHAMLKAPFFRFLGHRCRRCESDGRNRSLSDRVRSDRSCRNRRCRDRGHCHRDRPDRSRTDRGRPHRSRPDQGRRDRGRSDRTQSVIICWFIYNCSDRLNTRVRENESDWHDGMERMLQF